MTRKEKAALIINANRALRAGLYDDAKAIWDKLPITMLKVQRDVAKQMSNSDHVRRKEKEFFIDKEVRLSSYLKRRING